MKRLFLIINSHLVMSRSARGAWIETILCVIRLFLIIVALRPGRVD